MSHSCRGGVYKWIPADVGRIMNGQQLFVCKEEWSPSMDQEEPEPPHIKEEQEELWTSQEGEQLPGLEEADIIKFTFNPDLVKSEYDEEEQSSELHITQTENSEPLASTSSGQIKTEADGEDCGVSEADRKSTGGLETSREGHLLSSDLIKYQTDDWEQETQSDFKPPQTVMDMELGLNFDNLLTCDVFSTISHLETHQQGHSKQKSISCLVCKKGFTQQSCLNKDTRYLTGERPFICPVCEKEIKQKCSIKKHMITHVITVCKKDFRQQGYLKTHMRANIAEGPFSCMICKAHFTQIYSLKMHMITHTGGKNFICSICTKYFRLEGHLKTHMRAHTGESSITA